MIETDIKKRLRDGTPHHEKSIALFDFLEEIDWNHGGDYFCWKSCQKGTNGEYLMCGLDIYFESHDKDSECRESRIANRGDEPTKIYERRRLTHCPVGKI